MTEMRTALVTGLTGFVGSHVARALAEAGWCIIGLKRSTSSVAALGGLASLIPLVDVDRDPLGTAFDCADGGVDAVIHVATNLGRRIDAGGRSADTAPGSGMDGLVLADNVLFPLRLLEEAVARHVPLFVNTDTCVPRWYPAMRPYALSKSHFVEWGRAVCAGTGTRFVNVRLCQPYGPRLRPSMFIPWLVRQCLGSDGDIALTLGEQRRDFVYASDVAAAFLAILGGAERLPEFASLDCGSGKAMTVRAFAETVHRLTRSRATLRFGAIPYRDGEFNWEADVGSLGRLGWRPTVLLEDGLLRTLREDFNWP